MKKKKIEKDSLFFQTMQSSDVAIWSMVFGMLYSQIIGLITSLFTFIKELLVSSIEINSDVEYFEYAHMWIQKQRLLSSNRLTTGISTSYQRFFMSMTTGKPSKSDIIQLASGTHIIWYKRRMLWINMTGGDANTLPKLSIQIPFAKLKTIKQILEEIKSEYQQAQNKLRIFHYSGGWSINLIESRSMRKIMISPEIKNEIIEDISWFLRSEEWYRSKEIPYHRGYLFSGLPGTGKSSLAFGIAKYFNLPLYYLPISSILGNTESLMNHVQPKSIVLIEDIDKAIITEEITKELPNSSFMLQRDLKAVIRTLLQILDGILAPSGCLFIITTNKKEAIDPVLLRPGRMDKKYEFGYAKPPEIQKMFLWFFPDEVDASRDFVRSIGDRELVMAEIQEHLIRYINDVSRARIFEPITDSQI